jgi:Zn-dependent protease/predicted transcriptional regulator
MMLESPMSWSLKIARVAGTEIRVHITFILFLIWLGFIYYRLGGARAAVDGVAFILLIFLCVVLHEMGHAVAARSFGIPTPDITLLPIGGVARMQRMPDKPRQEIAVALAGPLVNVLIAAGIVLIGGVRLNPEAILMGPEAGLATRLAAVNIFLVLFNMIPAFPMDGGRVLRALIATRMPYSRATRIAARIGQGFAFLFGFVGLLGNPILIFIALFIYIAASQEAAFSNLKDSSLALTVGDAMITEFTVLNEDQSVSDGVEALLRTSQHEFPVIDGAGRVTGVLTRDGMLKALQRKGPATPVAEVMSRGIPLIRQTDSLESAFQKMQSCRCPALPVVDAWGRLVGIVSPENIGELMMVSAALPEGANLPWRLHTPAAARR